MIVSILIVLSYTCTVALIAYKIGYIVGVKHVDKYHGFKPVCELRHSGDRSIKPYEVLWIYNGKPYHLAYYDSETACHDAIRDISKHWKSVTLTFRHRTPDDIAHTIIRGCSGKISWQRAKN